uniref:Choline/carnitine acyltransferase domain-containing protein n=2 Tax=Parascaris univalens TaxID=6257 RepID=A0A915BUU6_PARUN
MPSALSGVVHARLTAKRIPCQGISDETEAQITSSTKPTNSITPEGSKSQRYTAAYLPFQPSWHYPSTLERATYKLLIGVGNRLWPVPPLYFGVSVVAATAYHMRLQTNVFLSLFPHANSLSLRILRVGFASFVTAYIPIFAIRWALKHFFFSYHGYLFESPVQPSLKTKIWRIVHKILAYAPRRLQSCDALLPSLPLPKLSDTIERYLDALKPILSEEEHAKVTNLAYEFAKRDGKLLQIVTWIYWCFVDNYVTPFWEKCAYLSSRNGLLINTSFGHCDIFQQRPSISQAERTARLMFLECLSMMAVDRQEIVPPGKGLTCAEHFKKYYTTTRIPGMHHDTQCSRHLSKHFVLIHKGRYYKVKAYDENNRLHSIEYLTEAVNEILVSEDESLDCEEYIAALTTDNRSKWCENRERFFINNAINRRALETIESAISFGSIEDNDLFSLGNTEFLEQFDKFMLVGDGKNIWADKSVCFSVSRNARWGGTNEHSIGDAIDHDLFLENFVTMDYCLSNDPINAAKLRGPTSACARYNCHSNKKIERINFDISEEMKREIMRCYREYKPQADDVDLSMMCFTEFGKGLIKQGNISPDAFIQMAIQLANYKDQGRFVHTYESASVRLFANSRTETLRSVTKESCAFVLAMLDQQCTNEKRLRLLRSAADCHVRHNRECMVGKGVDRHLFVLYIFSRLFRITSPFLQYFVNQSWPLSTSQAPKVASLPNEDKQPELSWFGGSFAAVTNDGYGICYRFAGNHSICIHITSYHSASNTDSHRFQKHLSDSLREMAALLSNHRVCTASKC